MLQCIIKALVNATSTSIQASIALQREKVLIVTQFYLD